MKTPARYLWLILGLVFVGLGGVGAVVPLMPTTIFLILAVACFARSSPKLEARLLNHPRFGRPLRQWREQGAVPLIGKVGAVIGMSLGLGVFWWVARPSPWLFLVVAIILAACGGYVVSRSRPH
jgi:uncharacterized membrane protein YbaN (DUF454 family)